MQIRDPVELRKNVRPAVEWNEEVSVSGAPGCVMGVSAHPCLPGFSAHRGLSTGEGAASSPTTAARQPLCVPAPVFASYSLMLCSQVFAAVVSSWRTDRFLAAACPASCPVIVLILQSLCLHTCLSSSFGWCRRLPPPLSFDQSLVYRGFLVASVDPGLMFLSVLTASLF